jgi:drug/metabolite transporter (DMT)-like permease
LCVVLNVISQLLLKTGMNTIGYFQMEVNNLLNTSIKIATNPNIIIGLLLYGLSFALWLVALSRLDVSMAYPLLSIGYIIMPFVAYLFLGEVLSILRIVGICIIIAGVYIVSKS